MHQIVLPPNHSFTRLVIKDCHERSLNGSQGTVVSTLRQTFWIPAVPFVTKKILKQCPPCIRENAKPKMAPLPIARVQEGSVWIHTGMDTVGPVMVKERRSQVKRWLIIFCSMTIRAIHIEIVRTVDSDSFIMALRRFIARRGEVLHLHSDSGRNFIGAAPELRAAVRALNSDELFRKYLTAQEIEFHFTPPKASHFGGAWESLIKSIKRTMRIVMKDRILHEDTIQTSICEIENALNSRPLSYVADDCQNPAPLTPNHFLHHVATTVTPPSLCADSDNYSQNDGVTLS